MKELEEIQSRKVISAYGGNGSIIETLYNGSLLIRPYDEWKCFADMKQVVTINNPRLLSLVQGSFTKVENLVAVPTPDWGDRANKVVYSPCNDDKNKTIGSYYFPGWFFCPRCRRLHKLADWKQLWNDAKIKDKKGNEKPKLDDKFDKYFPACYHCSEPKKKGNTTFISRQSLEQVRFALASFDTGNLIDIPFDKLWNLSNDGKAWVLDDAQSAPEELYYKSTKGGDGLQSINIYKGDGQGAPHKNMATIYNKYIVFKKGVDKGAYRVVLRNGTDVYFPNITSCIYIPKPTPKQIKIVRSMAAAGDTIDEIAENTDLSISQVNEILNRQGNTDPNADLFGMDEFFYITNPSIYNTKNQRRERDFWAIRYPNLKSKRIKGFYALRQLKETSVLTSYSRIGTSEKEWYDLNDDTVKPMRPGFKIPFNEFNYNHKRYDPTFMPAVESYGEGILVEIETNGIADNDVLIFAHTFCHLLMKEMEFLCGYPVTSLREKIYHDGNVIGFLIYTIQGAEGSYGGLISLMPSDTNSDGSSGDAKILKLIEAATDRSKDCPNDPICMNEKGHCFACVDLPETSCEKFNNDLSRVVFNRYL